ncbi:MAG: hypothetical protein ACM3P1_12070 [Candidatus Saccharibacteria bacterium]
MNTSTFIILVVLLFWAGFVSSISFMEAWLKFRAQGVTLNVGLSIGKKIFTSLNRMEWVFLFLYAIVGLSVLKLNFELRVILSMLVFAFLVIQTFFVLPALNHRVDIVLRGETPDKSFLHLYFGSLEILKVLLLIWLSYLWYKSALMNQTIINLELSK